MWQYSVMVLEEQVHGRVRPKGPLLSPREVAQAVVGEGSISEKRNQKLHMVAYSHRRLLSLRKEARKTQ